MKILEICPFSAGICGVWARVLSESKEFSKLGYEVIIFSSNIEKGTEKKCEAEQKINKIKIKRFESNQDLLDKSLSKNVTYFNFKEDLISLKPDLVITHLIHPHSFKALDVCQKMNIPCYLVTHAPFNVKRYFPLNLITKLHYFTKVKPNINNFTKIIAITKWEIPYLLKLGVKKDKIVYIPNGIPEEFFNPKKEKEKNKVLFLGRIASIKNLEILIYAAKLLPHIQFSLVGTSEEDYLKNLKDITKREKIENVTFYPPIYNLKEKIKCIDNHKFFVLPSKREAMPQVLIEAMSRGKIVISSDTDGGEEIIKDNENGFLFEIGNVGQLTKLIKKNIKGNKRVQNNARNSVKKFNWKTLIKKYIYLFSKR